jgi:DNA-directed RNA polymerase subunit RPC12/RpoP
MGMVVATAKESPVSTFVCPACKKPVNIESDSLNKWENCPHCGFFVHAPSSARPSPPGSPPPLPSMRPDGGKKADGIRRLRQFLFPDNRISIRFVMITSAISLVIGLFFGGFAMWAVGHYNLMSSNPVQYVEKPKYSRESFREAFVGKTLEEVIAVLGRPDKTSDDQGNVRSIDYKRILTHDPISKTVDRSVMLIFGFDPRAGNHRVVRDVYFYQ